MYPPRLPPYEPPDEVDFKYYTNDYDDPDPLPKGSSAEDKKEHDAVINKVTKSMRHTQEPKLKENNFGNSL